MDWRTWVFERATNSPGITALVDQDNIVQAMSLEEIPDERPFVVLVFGNDNPSFGGVVSQQRFTAWCHDNPGSYLRIDQILAALREELVDQVADSGAFCCEWQGDSEDLDDPSLKTILRTSSYLVTTRH